MPKPVYVIPGAQHSVTRPVVLDIVRQIIQWTGLPDETDILFSGEIEHVYQPGSTISVEKQFNKFETNTRWTLKIEEQAQEDRILATSILYADNPLIFQDHETHVFMKPAYAPTDVKITIGFKATDQTSARMWRDDVRTRVSMNRDIRNHAVSYSYLIPQECYLIAMKIWQMREAVAPYGETFEDYWGKCISSKARILTDMIGKNKEWGVAETQARILGFFDWSGEPEKGEKSGDNSSWDVSFAYTFKYDCPQAIIMEYPLMIHNQLIPEDYRPTSKSPRVEDFALSYSATAYAFSWFEQGRITAPLGTPGIAIPEYDEFYPADFSINPDTLRVITALSNIDLELGGDPLNLLDLTQLGDYDIDPDLIEFMKSESPWICQYRYSILNICVYCNEVMMQEGSYSVTRDLMVRFKEPQSPRDVFHVRFSVFQRPRLLADAAKLRLRNHYTAAMKIFHALDPSINISNPNSLPDDYMSLALFNKIAFDLDARFDSNRNSKIYQFNTVMTLLISAKRKSDATRQS